MGRMSLPSISKIEDVLDLLTDPDKYIQYMKEFKHAHDEATALLGELVVKETADAYLAKAADQLEASQRFAKEKTAELSTREAQVAEDEHACSLKREQLNRDTHAFEEHKEQAEYDLTYRQASFESNRKDQLAELTRREESLEANALALQILSVELDKRKAKLALALEA